MWHWDSRTHQFIVQQALGKCRQSFANLLQVEQEMLILGIEAPDRIFQDTTNHYYNCTPNQYDYHYGCVIKKICQKLELIEQLMENPHEIIINENYPPFLHLLLDSPLKVFCFEIGTLCHYVADLHQPFHTDGKERFADEETVHRVLEADVRLHLDELNIRLHRRSRLKNPEQFFTNKIYEINGFYDVLIDNYYLSPGKVKRQRWIHSKQIIEHCVTLSAQCIANLFLSYEDKMGVFAHAKQFSLLQKKIQSKLDPQKSYNLISYPSGTISLRER